MSDNLGDLTHPAFEPRPSARNPRYGSDAAGAIVREILSDLGKRWALPPEEFALVMARELARAFESSPLLLDELSFHVAAHLFRALRGQQLLADLAAAGIAIRLDGAVLRAGPRRLITPAVKQRIHSGRADLAAALKKVG